MITQIYKTVSEMVADRNITLNTICNTMGYYNIGDLGGCNYIIKKSSTIPGSIILQNGLVAEMISNNHVNVKQFGAYGNGKNDDTKAIQDAIDFLPTNGGTVIIPGGNFVITDSIKIGNGDHSNKVSSRNGIKIYGAGSGQNQSGNTVPTTLRYKGIIGGGTSAIRIDGKISDIEIKGVLIYCSTSPNAGIVASTICSCTFEDLKIINPLKYGMYLTGGNTIKGNNCSRNKFENIFIGLLTANSIGISIDGDYSSMNDMWQSMFMNIRVESHKTGCTGLYLGFQDSCTFIRCHFVTYSTNFTGIVFDGTGNDGYPAGNNFIDCSIANTKVIGDIRKQTFVNYGTYDNEVIPTHSMLQGVTDTGVTFGGWASSPYRDFDDILPGVTAATITMSKIVDAMRDGSQAYLTLWSPNFKLLELPAGVGNYTILEICKQQSTHVAITLRDLDNNDIYYKSKYGGIYTSWKKV